MVVFLNEMLLEYFKKDQPYRESRYECDVLSRSVRELSSRRVFYSASASPKKFGTAKQNTEKLPFYLTGIQQNHVKCKGTSC